MTVASARAPKTEPTSIPVLVAVLSVEVVVVGIGGVVDVATLEDAPALGDGGGVGVVKEKETPICVANDEA